MADLPALRDSSRRLMSTAASEDVRLAAIPGLLWRRRYLIAGVMLLAGLASVAYLMLAEKRYDGEALIAVQQAQPQLLGEQRTPGTIVQSDQYAATQAQIIGSATVLIDAAMRLEKDPAFAGKTDLYRNLRSKVWTDVDRVSQVITIGYECGDPDEAALVLRAILDSFIHYARAEREAVSREVIDALEADRKQRSDELQKATAALLDLQAQYSVISLSDDYATVVTDHLRKLSTALSEAKFEAVRSRTAYDESVRSLNVNPEALDRFEQARGFETFSATESVDDVSQRLQMISALQVRLRDAQRVGGPKHPHVMAYRAQLEQVVLGYVSALRQSMLVAEKRVSDLQGQLQQQQELANRLTGAAVEFGRVRAEVKRLERLIELINDRINQEQVSQRSRFELVRVVEPPRPPDSAAWPRASRVLPMGLAAGLALAVGLTFLLEWQNPRVRSLEQVESLIHAPVLGLVPRTSIHQELTHRAAQLEPAGLLAEAFRMVRTTLLKQTGVEPHTIAITSASAREGKTSSAHNLAIVLAQAGQRVLLVDADMRKVTDWTGAAGDEREGLSTVLAGQSAWRDAIHRGRNGAPDILPAGPLPDNPDELLNSSAFSRLIDDTRDAYDHVIFDTPPVTCVADGRIIAASCDTTVMIVRAEHSNLKCCKAAYQSLLLVGAHLGGVVVNDVASGPLMSYGGLGSYGYYAEARVMPRESEQTPDRLHAAQADRDGMR